MAANELVPKQTPTVDVTPARGTEARAIEEGV